MAYAVGMIPAEFWGMSIAEVFAVIEARRPVPAKKDAAENPDNEPEEITPQDTAEAMETTLRLLTKGMGGSVVVRHG